MTLTATEFASLRSAMWHFYLSTYLEKLSAAQTPDEVIERALVLVNEMNTAARHGVLTVADGAAIGPVLSPAALTAIAVTSGEAARLKALCLDENLPVRAVLSAEAVSALIVDRASSS